MKIFELLAKALKARCAGAAMTGTAIHVGWKPAWLVWFYIVKDKSIDLVFSWRVLWVFYACLSPSFVHLLFVVVIFPGPLHLRGTCRWWWCQVSLGCLPSCRSHLKPLVRCLANCWSLTDGFPPCFLSRTFLNRWTTSWGCLSLRKICT